MNDNEAVVRIVGDASQVAPAVEQAKGEVGSIAPMLAQLNAGFAELGALIKASMDPGARAAAEMSSEMRHLHEETEAESFSLKELALSVHEGVESLNGMKFAAKELAEVWLAAFAVEQVADWAKEFAEASENIEHLAQRFGMSTQDVQGLNVVAKQTGLSLDTMTNAMQILDRNQVKAEQSGSAVSNAFKAVGVSMNDGLTQMQKFAAIADKFKNMDDGPKKVALAMELFGRSGAQLIPVLDRGGDALREMGEEAKKYGAAYTDMAESSQAKGVALAESINETGVAWQGVTNMLGDAFGPALKEITDGINLMIRAMIDSYTSGGAVAVIFQTIVDVVEVVGDVLNTLGAVFRVLWDVVYDVVSQIGAIVLDVFNVKVGGGTMSAQQHFNQLRDAIVVFKDAVVIALQAIGLAVETFVGVLRAMADVARDVFTMNWGSIQADWQNGINRVADIAAAGMKRIKDAAAEAKAAVDAFGKGEAPGGASEPKPEEKPTHHGFDPDLGKTPKEKKEKKPKDDLVQQLDAELKAREVAWAMQQDAQGTAQEYSLQSIADYWKQALSRADLSEKDRLAISEKYLAAHGKLTEEEFKAVLDGYKGQIEAAKGNSAEVLRLTQAEADAIGHHYGLQSNQYKEAMNQVVAARRSAEEQIRKLAEETQAELDKLRTDQVDREKAASEFRVAMEIETKAQQIAQERTFENTRFQIASEGLQARLALYAKDPNANPVEVAKLKHQLADVERKHQATLTDIDQKAILERTALERNAVNSTAQLWSSNISKMITLQQGFAATLGNLYKGMVSVLSDALGSIIQKWLEQHLAALILGGAQSKLSAAGEITDNAAIAGSAAWASTAAIPIVGPELAPAAAAAASAGALGFLGALVVPSGAGGIWDVEGGLTMLHEKEMVLPAWAAQPLRSMLGGAANSNAPAPANDGARGGDLHLHLYFPGQIVTSPAALTQWARSNAAPLTAGLRPHIERWHKPS